MRTLAGAAPFEVGQSILCRGLDEHDRITNVLPVRVVRDEADLVALWLPMGTLSIKPELIDHTPGTPRCWVDGNWRLTKSAWRREVLILVRPAERWATWVKWSPEREFQGWYVNLQSELTRTRLGFDHLDHQLDILVATDRSWRYKDEVELEICVEMGRLTPKQAVAIRADGAAVVQRIEADDPPFSRGWERWTPNPTWALPRLTPDWTDLSMYHSP